MGGTLPLPARAPLVLTQRQSTLPIEPNAFGLKQQPLAPHAVRLGSRADRPLRVHHPVPWHHIIGVPERVPGQTGLPSEARQSRDLPIGGHAATRYPPDYGEDARVAGRSLRRQ